MAMGSTQSLADMSTRNLPRVEGGQMLADCLENVGASTSQPYGPSQLVTRWLSSFFNSFLKTKFCSVELLLRGNLICYHDATVAK
jgi:hypothetical protein